MRRLSVCALAMFALSAPGADAHEPRRGDAGWPAKIFRQQPAPLIAAQRAEPPMVASPRAACGPGSRPEPGLQGRVPGGAVSRDGFTCNTRLVGRDKGSGGFKVHRFVDRAGRECAYYDTALQVPLGLTVEGGGLGTAVLDMSDPARPVRVRTLTTPAMLSPHESLVLSQERGLLIAVMGNVATLPGFVDIYDLNEDCRDPELRSSLPVGVLGHESGLSADGKTFFATSLFTYTVTAIDIADPDRPRPLWQGLYNSHGLSLSADGRRAYLAALDGLITLDTTEIQERRPQPQVREVSRLMWSNITIPQNALPVTIKGRPYLVEVDEFSGNETSRIAQGNGSRVGAARLIDISDETRPKVVSNLRLEVHQKEHRAALAEDPGALFPGQGYAAHYCSVPRTVDPGIVACSMIASGLRVFDIRDPLAPREIAYFVAPPAPSPFTRERSNYAMSAPAFVPERDEIWYSDAAGGFYALELTNGAWPEDDAGRAPARPAPLLRVFRSRGRVVSYRLGERARVRVTILRGTRVVSRSRAVTRAAGRTYRVRLRGLGRGAYRVRITASAGDRTATKSLSARRASGASRG